MHADEDVVRSDLGLVDVHALQDVRRPTFT
jgi:hypothetical protein